MKLTNKIKKAIVNIEDYNLIINKNRLNLSISTQDILNKQLELIEHLKKLQLKQDRIDKLNNINEINNENGR